MRFHSKPRPLRKRDVKVGMRVTCEVPAPAYAPFRSQLFTPGMIGTVASVDVPCVTYKYRKELHGTATFAVVDFEDNGRTYRCALYYRNIKVIEDGSTTPRGRRHKKGVR